MWSIISFIICTVCCAASGRYWAKNARFVEYTFRYEKGMRRTVINTDVAAFAFFSTGAVFSLIQMVT